MQRSRQIIAAADLEDRARGQGMEFTLRYALAHLVEEIARRCGHLGLLREALDGQTGEWPHPGHPWDASRACAISPRGGEPRRSRESWKRAWE